MTAAVLLADLRRRDVILRVESGDLDCDGPAAVLTDATLETIRLHKPELIRLLSPPGPPQPPMISHPHLRNVWIAEGSESDPFNVLADVGSA